MQDWERRAILDFAQKHAGEGYRRLTFMMLDEDVVAVSPSTVYRTLRAAGRLNGQTPPPTKKGKGFHQPDGPHRHWHVDISYLNLAGTFYYLCSVLDGYSRFIVHHDIRESMTETDVEIILEGAKGKFPGERPRIITDNGPQFTARDFKEFIRHSQMTHVRTSPYYPQSNGKIERWHRSLKHECIRPGVPLCLEDAKRLVARYVDYYNVERLHSSIGYVAPLEKLEGWDTLVFSERDRKLDEARQRRKALRGAARKKAAAQVQQQTVDFAEVRRAVSMKQVLDSLGLMKGLRGSVQLRGPCPFHGSADEPRSRSFAVDLRKNVFRCFSPECGVQGNVLDFWARYHGLPLREAALQLQERPDSNREEEPVLPFLPEPVEETSYGPYCR